MKNKKLLYILAPVVIIVWGIIFYRIFSQIKKKNTGYIPSFQISEMPVENIKRDTFVIVASYRDPFLTSNYVKKPPKEEDNKEIKSVKRNQPVTQRRINRRVRWPNIEYSGSIYNKDSKQYIAVIKINNNGFLMYSNETNMDVTIIKIYEDSVRLSFSGEEKTFIKTGNTN